MAELCDDLAPAARAGGTVDMHAALCNVALKAVGEAAFGCVMQEAVDREAAKAPICLFQQFRSLGRSQLCSPLH